MNKKFMTLGVAAAVGLAGFVALPVIAAKLTVNNDVVNYKTMTARTKDGKNFAYRAKTKLYKELDVSADQTVDAAEMKEYILGTKTDVEDLSTKADKVKFWGKDDNNDGNGTIGNPFGDKKKAIDAAGELADGNTVPVVEKSDSLVVKGSFAQAQGYIKALTAEAKKWIEEDKDASTEDKTNIEEKLAKFTVKINANNAVGAFTITNEMVNDLATFVNETKGKIEISFEKEGNRDLNMANLTQISNLSGISFTKAFVNGNAVHALYAKPFLPFISGEVLVTGDKDVTILNGSNKDDGKKPEINPEDNKKDDNKKDDNKKNEENAAGNKDKAADKGKLKAPDTGIVK